MLWMLYQYIIWNGVQKGSRGYSRMGVLAFVYKLPISLSTPFFSLSLS